MKPIKTNSSTNTQCAQLKVPLTTDEVLNELITLSNIQDMKRTIVGAMFSGIDASGIEKLIRDTKMFSGMKLNEYIDTLAEKLVRGKQED